ncbi:MAG: hypothetical protein A3F82_08590 [Deltaproteobacteria bacterium RIFCSPLOWO2_12_FULL_44_12]|nr:MAG: hypothetical protein A3D98_01315 [Deltaproteobacteria bacterium RIFCSPHIGHO2_12_FULL_44_21]OGQ43719.1 MAG: hypothetical protein A3I70_05550 [Deltaproteobacteria bacterium RIFCSPLOWO2_02_FULL_44_34]OGQ69648.1 MAG: hypothetical protein A3F82_08590 [Deltaproteobacteria bacterium RIFCSPLOWO2_12_FULL_44_12]
MQTETGEFKNAHQNFQIAHFLNPSFEGAFVKQKNLELFLQDRAKHYYTEGLRAHAASRPAEAKLFWQKALHVILDESDPFHQKITKALSGAFEYTPIRLQTEQKMNQNNARGKMAVVKSFLESGNMAQAMLTLKEALYENPKDERAQDVLGRLEKAQVKQVATEDLSETINSKFTKAQKIFEEAKELEKNKNALQAYKKYKEGVSLFAENDLKPPFYNQLLAQQNDIETLLKKELEPLLTKWKQTLDDPGNGLKEIGVKLKKVVEQYPPSTQAQELLAKLYSKLNQLALPQLMEANTLQELEGCVASMDPFASVKEIAIFQEVEAWQEANRNLQTCLVFQKNKNENNR